LLRAVRRIEKGERKVRVDVASNDEIGRLARAFEEMNVAIADRELRLAEVNRSLRELFDHMRQAIVVFDREGRVVGAQSRQAEVVFGHPELCGERVHELLYPGAGSWDAELRAFDEWVEVAFQARAEDWDALASLAPPAVRLHDGGERVLTLEFRPILVDDEIDRIMLLATDITQQKMLEREVALQGERHARQMAAMRRLVSGGGQQFVGFLDAARERLDRALDLATSTEELPLAELNEVFGQVHTLRAEAKSFGLDELAGQVTSIEERLGLLRASAIAAGGGVVASRDAELAAAVKSARELVDDAERLFVEASPIGRAVLEQINVRRPDLTRLCELALVQGGEIGALAERLSARTLGELAAAVGERASGWADAVQKRARVDVDGREVLVPERLARVLGGVLTHLVRNSIAHGIERPEERERLGKPVVGSVRIKGSQGSGAALAPTIEVEDDGRGFADNPLLSDLAARRAPLDVDDARHGSFRAVPAQAATELEGRGIGLAAIVRDLEAAGYRLEASTTDSGGARFSLVPSPSAAGRGAA
jgi:methyl-accepting chemotaxis protein